MPLPKISEARNLSDEELAQAIIDVKSNYFSYGCKSHPVLDKPHQFKHNRLAQLLSVEHERKRQQQHKLTRLPLQKKSR